jgi:hypothetical protein
MTSPEFASAVLEAIISSNSRFKEDGGDPFEAITETDLISALREKGWKLPPAGHLNNIIRDEGFKVKQGKNFKGKVRKILHDGRTGRAMADSNTIIFI